MKETLVLPDGKHLNMKAKPICGSIIYMYAFREYLRSHPEAVREYSRIKEEGAALYPFDIEKYIEHKSPFVEKIYSEIGI